jgi:[ribosomal protein S5]-alanine N-acetyltransferase
MLNSTPKNNRSKKTGFLKTKRIFFRTWRESDINLAIDLWGDPQVTRYINSRRKLSSEDIRSMLSLEILNEKQYGIQYWPIFLKTDNSHVGCCGLRLYKPAQNIFEIGFHIRKENWGRDFASEAAIAVMGYAFDILAINGLFAGHNPNNIASKHLLLKLGFRFTHDEYYAPTGLYHPSYMLTRDEYRCNQ